MAVLSPSLVVAMCVMFVLTRLHRHYYIFEKPFLFGLKHCLEPDPQQLAAIAEASASAKNPQSQAKKKGKSTGKNSSSSKQKISVSALSIRRSTLNATFFSTEAEFPHHRELDHVMSISCGYLASYLFEDLSKCFFPELLENTRSFYVAVLGVGFAVMQSWRISIGLTSTRIMLSLTGAAWLVAMFILSAGDLPNFIMFEKAFQGLQSGISDILVSRLQLSQSDAEAYGWKLSIFMRFLVSVAAAFVAASTAAPARRFSRIDFELNRLYRKDEISEREDPYFLGRPSPLTMLMVALDYIVPLITVSFLCMTPREGEKYETWRLLALLSCVVIRFATMRIRLQSYLDGAIDAYRKFWTQKSPSGVEAAGRSASIQVAGTSFYLLMIAMAYIAPAMVPLLLTFVAKLEGGISSGFCPVSSDLEVNPFNMFAREIAAFLAWLSIASYAIFGCVSLLVEFALDILYPGARDFIGKLPMPTSASERRKQKRIMQEHMLKNRVVYKPGKD